MNWVKKGVSILTAAVVVGVAGVGLSLNVTDPSLAETVQPMKAGDDHTVDTVKEPDGDTVLTKTKLTLGVGEMYALSANHVIEEWSSSRDDLVQIDSGEVYARAVGSSMVGALAEDGDEAKCLVIVRQAPDEVLLTCADLTLGVGESYKLQAILPVGTAAASKVFSTDRSDILKMTQTDGQAEFTALKPGKAVVTVSLYNGKKADCTVTVKEAPESLTLSRNDLTLGIGESCTLKAKLPENSGARQIQYATSSGCVNISPKGSELTVTAQEEGTAEVTASVYTKQQDTCTVTVMQAPETVQLDANELTLSVGESAELSGTVNEGAASSRKTYSCDNKDVLQMTGSSGKAVFKALKPGTAVITVTTYNGKTDSCTVTVREEEKQETASPLEQQMAANPQQQQTTATPEGQRTFVYASDPSLAGERYLDVSDNTAVLTPGETAFAAVSSAYSGTLTFRSLDEGVAVVDQQGNITAVDYGNTDIIVTDEAGAVGKFEVIVTTGSGMDYADINSIEALLNGSELKPMKTNYEPVDQMVDQIFARILTDDMTPGQKLKACYQYLATQCTYGYDGYKAVSVPDYLSEQDREIVEFSYCILKDRIGTCENFAAAFTVMTRRIGFETNFVYGDVGMSAGGYGGHYWTDVNVYGKHYIFDTQVENNNGGASGNIQYYFYGLRPEYSYGMYRYNFIETVHAFRRGV